MLKRLWYVLSILWALAVFLPDVLGGIGINWRNITVGLGPLCLGWIIAWLARFVVTGSLHRPRPVRSMRPMSARFRK